MSHTDWLEANQKLLVAEFARLRGILAERDVSPLQDAVADARASMPSISAIDLLMQLFELSGFERDLILLSAGVEMDADLCSLVGRRNHSASHNGVSFGLALACLGTPHWSALTPSAPLRRWRLIAPEDVRALSTSRLSLDERALHFVAGINDFDSRLVSRLRLETAERGLGRDQRREMERAVEILCRNASSSPAIQLIGDDVDAQIETSRLIAESMGMNLHVLKSTEIPRNPSELETFSILCSRESRLRPYVLLVDFLESDTSIAAEFIDGHQGTVLARGSSPLNLARLDHRLRVDRPPASDQRELWMLAMGQHADKLNGSLEHLASQYRLGYGAMSRAAARVAQLGSDPRASLEVIKASCRETTRARLDGLAQPIACAATWDDLVLPPPQVATLRQVAAHVRQRVRVFDQWGFGKRSSRGQGTTVLFSGESGTGKTMAAEVLANDLGLDLFRIDLASIVSKYIGETEKNLRRVFDAAEDSAAILLFDEADALFGKRSEVKDSHDRYANIEVSYLLQRMEEYRGLAILTTNLKGTLDSAFERRLRFVLPFPFPDRAAREQIWRVSIPEGTPVEDLDYGKLARLSVAGGAIRNITLNAAFIAAEADAPIAMGHLLQAARVEAAKRDRPMADAETRGWA